MMLGSMPILMAVIAGLYQVGMHVFEGVDHSYWESVEWATETFTTTDYGQGERWTHPAMIVYVGFIQFVGVSWVFLVFPIFLLPYFEERFEGRLPMKFPKLDDCVLVYRYGPEVGALVDELERREVPVVIYEEDEAVARRLFERGRTVVFGSLQDDPDLSPVLEARGVVANGSDHQNIVLTMTVRHLGFKGPIVALVETPARRNPMIRAGATAVFSPEHVLAAAVAAKGSFKLSPRLHGSQSLGKYLEIAEVRVDSESEWAGKTLAEAKVRARTGATIIGQWVDGELEQPNPDDLLHEGSILVAVGTSHSIGKLGELTTPVHTEGQIVVLAHGITGEKVVELLRTIGEDVAVLSTEQGDGIDFVGDVLDPALLAEAGVREAQSVIIALEDDSAALFATAVVRGLAPHVVLIAGVQRAQSIGRVRRAGADFAMSIGQVASQLLAYQLLGEESVSLESQIKVVKTLAGELVGVRLHATQVRSDTGCSIVAIERGSKIILEFDSDFHIEAEDSVYITGTPDNIKEYFNFYQDTQPKAGTSH